MTKTKPGCKHTMVVTVLGVFVLFSLLHFLSTSSIAEWKSFSFNFAEITSIAVDPGNCDTVFAGTRNAGVFKTTDAGVSWAPARGGLTFYTIRSLAIDPVHNNVIYAGTDFDGVWKSTDGGKSWVKASNGLPGFIVFRLVIDPSHPDTIYAGLGGGVALSLGNIYKSVNGGLTWERKDNGIPTTNTGDYTKGAVEKIAIDPDSPAKLYTATVHFPGVFASIDGGETWTPINKNLDFEIRVTALSVDRHHGGRLSAYFDSPTPPYNKGYFFYDNLTGWQKVSVDSGPWFPSYLYFHPLDPTVIYASGSQFDKSLDGGQTWIDMGSYFADIACHPDLPDTIYAAYSNFTAYDPEIQGVFKSSDQGATWSFAASGITGAVVRSVAVDPASPGIMYFGSGSGYLARTQDGGQTWQQCPITDEDGDPTYYFGFEINDIRIVPTKPSEVYVVGSSLYKSSNRGLTFTEIAEVKYPNCIAIDPVNSNIVYTSESFGSGIKKSLDGGQNWQLLQNGLPDIEVLALAVDPSQSASIWAGTTRGLSNPDSGVYRSLDGGAHWQAKLKLSDSGEEIMALVVHPRNSNVVVLGIGDRFGRPGRILISSDGGETWHETCGGLGHRTPSFLTLEMRRRFMRLLRGLGCCIRLTAAKHGHLTTTGYFIRMSTPWRPVPKAPTTSSPAVMARDSIIQIL